MASYVSPFSTTLILAHPALEMNGYRPDLNTRVVPLLFLDNGIVHMMKSNA